MENRGLLSRTQVGRGTEVRLTSDGHEIMEKIGECIEKFNTRYTSLIGEKNVESLTSNVYEASLRLR